MIFRTRSGYLSDRIRRGFSGHGTRRVPRQTLLMVREARVIYKGSRPLTAFSTLGAGLVETNNVFRVKNSARRRFIAPRSSTFGFPC